MTEPEPDLTDELRRYVTEWVARSALRIRDELCDAQLQIVLSQPQSDEDGTLYLEFVANETIVSRTGGGWVTGVRFDLKGRSP